MRFYKKNIKNRSLIHFYIISLLLQQHVPVQLPCYALAFRWSPPNWRSETDLSKYTNSRECTRQLPTFKSKLSSLGVAGGVYIVLV